MRVKLEWLNELVDLTGLSIKEIVEKVSLYSIEVENVDKIVHASDIVIGHVLTKTKHPNSDHLNCLTVDVKDEVLNIVCGASNVDAGQYVIVAKVGCVLDGGEIKKSKIRGEESCGMVCSLQELGIEKKYIDDKYLSGIYYFEDEVEVGMPAAKVLNLHDEILELGLTPNRADMLSMIGVAYELSAVFNRPLKPLVKKVVRTYSQEKLNIKIDTPTCLSYYGQIIKDVEVKPSPRWLSSRLIAFGIRPINNLVDITNYVLALFGQPLHAFDLDVLGNNIVIRNALKNEEIVTLDEQIRKLLPTDIVITDGKVSQCLGGVMGGLVSEISPTTKNIMLEAAVFDPMTISSTSKRLNLRSESSMRYEKGIDINRTKEALEYACYLYQTLANAKIVNEPFHQGISNVPDKEITITPSDVEKLLGIKIPKKEIIAIIKSLHFEVDDNLLIKVPSRRGDIKIKEDIIEEVSRLYGYEKLPLTLPVDDQAGLLKKSQENTRKLKSLLTNLGLNEVISYSLVSKEEKEEFNIIEKMPSSYIELLMPLTDEHQYFRTNLMQSIINVVKYNYARKNKNIAFFEMGTVYYTTGSIEEEQNRHEDVHLAIALANEFSNTSWANKSEKADFYLLKGIVNEVFEVLGLNVEYLALSKEYKQLHPNRSATIVVNNNPVGYIGQVHPKYAMDNDLDDVYICEIDMTKLIHYEKETPKFIPINKLPSVERDLALVMKKDVLAQEVVETIKKADKEALTNVTIFDLYEGENIAADEKSLAIKLEFSSTEPLTEEIINNKIKKILKALEYKMNVKLRS